MLPLCMRNPGSRAAVKAVVVLIVVACLYRASWTTETRFPAASNARLGTWVGKEFRLGDYKPYEKDCTLDVEHLQALQKRHNLGDEFEYAQRQVMFHRRPGIGRESMTRLNQSFMPDKFGVYRPSEQGGLGKLAEPLVCQEPIEIDVSTSPSPKTVDASHLMFGVSTTYARFLDPVSKPVGDWTYWLTDGDGKSNGGKLLLTLIDASDAELEHVKHVLTEAGIDADVFSGDSTVQMAVRYLGLVPLLSDHPEASKKQWLVVCDDDTFFPNMHGLIGELAKFDPSIMLYIGTMSEDFVAVDRHGSQAFGGAGVIFSLPLARKISELFTECQSEHMLQISDSQWGVQGDMLLRNCIYENTQTRLTLMRDLWQLDFGDDPSGFYEWVQRPLSLHHYRGGDLWHVASPIDLTKIAYTCGEDCTLQRFRTADDVIFSSYSISAHPQGISWNVDQVERTLRINTPDSGWNLDYTFGPQRPTLSGTGMKVQWRMEGSVLRPDGAVVYTYIRRKGDERWKDPQGKSLSTIDSVIELFWVPGS